MSTTHLEDVDAFGAGVNATQGSGMRWEPPVIHRMSVTQSESGFNPSKNESTNSVTGHS